MSDYTVRLIDMAPSVKGLISLGPDGYPNIFINARLSREEQRKALAHELRHLKDDDFYNDRPTKEIER